MTQVPQEFNFGSKENIENKDMLLYLKEMYRILARAINEKPSIVSVEDFPSSTSEATLLTIGDIFLKQSTNEAKMITSRPSQTTVVLTNIT